MSEQMDLSKRLPPKYGDDVLYGMMVPDEIAKLTRLYDAIGKWKALTDCEFQTLSQSASQQRNPAWAEYGYDPIADEAFMLLDTERVMFANLGVSIASTAENFIVRICKHRNVPLTDSDGESDFGIICCNFSVFLGARVSDLPGYAGNQRSRLLGNCFKHNAGKTDARFARKYKTTSEMAIEYEKENWIDMIEGTRVLLNEISQRIKPLSVP